MDANAGVRPSEKQSTGGGLRQFLDFQRDKADTHKGNLLLGLPGHHGVHPDDVVPDTHDLCRLHLGGVLRPERQYCGKE